MSTISVIIPNFNRAGLIGETLESILRQTRPADELIVVDDGSTDDSVNEIGKFGARVRLIRQANAGPAAARNRGLAAASGEFIQFFDSDDLCSRNKLEAQAAALERTGADLAYGPWLQARLEDGLARYPEVPLQQGRLPPERSPLAWFLRGWVIVFQCCMIRRTLLDRVGPYRTELTLGEDAELLFRMLMAGARIVHVPEALVLYRLHFGAQLSRGGVDDARWARDWLSYATMIEEALRANPGAVSPADAAQWRWTLREAQRQHRAVLGPGAGESGPAPGLPVALACRARRLLARWRSGLSRRATGSSFARPYMPGPLDHRQHELIRGIGYDPVRDPSAGA